MSGAAASSLAALSPRLHRRAGRRADQASQRRQARGAACQPRRGEPDLAYGAFQRGHYITAFREATRRVEEKDDPKAMTLLGELYADGLGVPNDDKKAADWYKLAIDRGDREAMFALAMFRMTGRAGPPTARRARGSSPGRQARPCRRGLQSRAALSRRPDLPAGFHARRRTVAHRRRCRQSGSPVRAGDNLQGRPGRDEGPAAKPPACSAPRRSPTTPTPRSNTASRCSTAPASPRTKPPPPTICSAAQKSSAIAQNGSPSCTPPAAA